MPARPIDFELCKVGAAVPHLANRRRSFVLDPGGRSGERFRQTLEVSFPSANRKVEVMTAVVFCAGFCAKGVRRSGVRGDTLRRERPSP